MSNLPPQIMASQKAALDTLFALQNSAFAGFEKLVDLNLRVVRATIDETAQKAQEAVVLEDPQQAVAFATSLAQPSAEKVLAYGKHVYDIVSGVQAEVAKLAEAQIAQNQRQIAETVEHLSKNAPAGAEGAVALVKSSLATANSAYDSLAKATKQAVEVTESNIAAATSATFEAAETAKQAAAQTAARATGASSNNQRRAASAS